MRKAKNKITQTILKAINISCCFMLISCSSNTSNFNFDSAQWKSDLNGCKGLRISLQEQVEEIRLKLVGLNERDIRQLVGKPDTEELMERSQKVYIYYLSPGPKCISTTIKEFTILKVRFDALGTVREATLTTTL